MTTSDGSIRIDTRIDTSGVNAGTQQIGQAVEKNVAKPVQGMTKSLSRSFTGILNIIKGIGKALVLAFVGGSILNAIRSVISSFDFGDRIKPLTNALDELKGTFANLIATALIPLIPYLVSAVEWLTRMLQTVSQLVAAFFGLKQTAGNIMTKAASEAKKAAKDAKGALAAFDQINVLAKQQEQNAPEGPTASPAPLTVPDDLFNKVQELKNKAKEFIETIANSEPWKRTMAFLEAEWESIKRGWRRTVEFINNEWEDIKEFGRRTWQFIKDDFALLGDILQSGWQRTVEFLKAEWDTLKNFGTNTWEFIKADFAALVDFFSVAWSNVTQFVESEWRGIQDAAASVWSAIEEIWGNVSDWFRVHVTEPIAQFFSDVWETISTKARGAIDSVQGTWSTLVSWFKTNIFAPIANGFGSMWEDVKLGFQRAFTGLKDFAKSTFNSIIDFINRLIDGVVNGINAVIGAANAIASFGGFPELATVTAPKIPRLATGAVIPPNSEFLAIMGDQRSGRNIEAPEALIRQLLREELGNIRAEIQIEYTGSMAALVRQLSPEIKKENIRIGRSLLSSGVTK